jgi:hypothetical protein
MRMLVTFCTDHPSEKAVLNYSGLAAKQLDCGLALMDFSVVRGKPPSEDLNYHFLQPAKMQGIKVFFWGHKHLQNMVNLFPDYTGTWLSNRLDYGVMRNKAYLLAAAAGAQSLQFFDDDTEPLDLDILETHSRILHKGNLAAVSGNYDGPRAVTVSMFKEKTNQQAFLELMHQNTGFKIIRPGIVGGALAVDLKFAAQAPFPSLNETTMSDDMLITFLAGLLNQKTVQSHKKVYHRHASDRLADSWISGYMARMLRITALMSVLRTDRVKEKLSECLKGNFRPLDPGDFDPSETLNRINGLIQDLDNLARAESNSAMISIIGRLPVDFPPVKLLDQTAEGLRDYFKLLEGWPKMMSQAARLGQKWVQV